MTVLPIRHTVLALLLSQSLSCAVFAANEGTLAGHLTRAVDHQPVPGASVLIKETGAKVITAADGSYRFTGLAPGGYTLVIQAGGTPIERRISIGASGSVAAEIALDPGALSTQVEQVTVIGQKLGVESARAAQQFAPNLINVTTADQIERLPDVNAAEAVKRLPGVSLETDTGEGRYINIRGLDSELNSTTFDGLRLPPQNNATGTGGGRAVALDAIPAGIIGSITVTKTNTPEQDAEALGGTIEITSKAMPVNSNGFVDGHLGTGYESLRGTGITDGEIAAGTRFGPSDLPVGSWVGYSDKPFSLVVSASYYADRRGIDDEEAGYVDTPGIPGRAYSDLEQRYYQYDRTRHGYGLDLEYQPDAQNTWYLRAFNVGYTEEKSDNRLVWSFAGTPYTAPGIPPNAFIDGVTSMDKELSYEKETIEDNIFIVGGKNVFDSGAVLDYHAAHADGFDKQYYSYSVDFNYTPPAGALAQYDNQSNPDFPSIKPLNFNPYNWSNYLLANPLNPNLGALNSNGGGLSGQIANTYDQENTLGANLRIPLHFTDDDNENVKFGVNARFRDRVVTQNPDSYNIPLDEVVPLTSVQAGGPISYYNNLYNIGPNILPSTVLRLFPPSFSYFNTAPGGDIASAQSAYLGAEEDVYAAYGQYEFGWGNWSFLAGARVEATRASYSSIGSVTPLVGNPYATTDTAGASYNNFFPTLQGRYQFSPDLIGRATISTAIGRPGFQQNTSQESIDFTQNTVTVGNPNLKPTTGVNYDFSIEDYLPHGGIISAGIFDKQFTNYIAGTSIRGSFPGYPFNDFAPGTDTLASWINLPSSYARGVELNYEQHFRELPGWLSGFGLGFNFTYVDSSFEIRPGEYSMLPSTSKHTANAMLFYERNGWNLELAAYYVSSDLFSIGTSPDNDTWSAPIVQVDFGASYRFDKHWAAYFNAKNLTNYALKFTEGTADRPIQREFYGPTYTAGVRFNFD